MRRLVLMRHAKSSWDSPTLSDHDRPLNARGKRSAIALGEWLRKNDLMPDQSLVSDAARTRATYAGLGLTEEPALMSKLYHAGPETLAETLRDATGSCVLILGHNPGIAEFASYIVSHPPDHPRFFDYPTGATLVADFDIDRWAELQLNTGRVHAFIIPRELEG